MNRGAPKAEGSRVTNICRLADASCEVCETESSAPMNRADRCPILAGWARVGANNLSP
jgi:hypothetical protein